MVLLAYFLLLLGLSLLPALFWLYIFYLQDMNREPWSLVISSFLLGSLMVPPAALLEAPFSPILREGLSLLSMTLSLGLLEEVLKLLPVLLFIYPRDEFNEVSDGILYVLAAGLGFAFLENLFYSLLYGLQVGVIRAFLTSLAHATFSGIMGFYLGLTGVYPHRSRVLLLGGLLQASLFHGLYNFLLIGAFLPLSYLLFAFFCLQIYLFSLIKKARLFAPF